jgi:hypothetical protein
MVTLKTVRGMSAALLVPLAGATLSLVGIGAPAASASTGPQATLGTAASAGLMTAAANDPITRSEVRTRAQSWIDDHVPYSQSLFHPNQYGNYRQDCSGYVSMAWGLDNSYTTWTLQPFMDTISWADLQVGDALWRQDSDTQHIALFVGWGDAAHTMPIVMEEYNTGKFAEQRTWPASYARTFTPKRYKNIIGSASAGRPADLVRLEDNGVLTGWRNAGGFAGWAMPDTVGNAGTATTSRVRFADLDGDGLADLIRVEDDGSLTAWRSTGYGAWAAPAMVGNAGTTDASRVRFGDLDGDGRADLIRVDDTGALTAWRSTGFGAWAAPAGIGNVGTGDVSRVRFADLDGDGRADLIRIEDNGSLSAWQSTGFGAWAAPAAVGNDGTTNAAQAQFADLDGDGRADLVRLGDDGSLTGWRSTGFGAWAAPAAIGNAGTTDPSRIFFANIG